ncbi:protein disulfide oxidoreductase [Shewanella sp. JM162201]|uniref:Protein disulfide oxidoreductase n=1 Tax=Shewanella jiangmenensis TaxID=2837387 RepID=A0ABS5VB82_9GAMM|nr:protein disulfide oxidoreductase [Shewanella jiangmenensis]MBT1446293.1 protein disulfide oxidoreductase [Shewanella jiangmenensis]
MDPKPKKSRRKQLLLEAAIAMALFYGIAAFQQKDMLKDTAPAISASGVEHSLLTLPHSGGKPTLVYFFADWCSVCKLTSPAISRIESDYPVVAIAVDSGNDERVRAFLQQQGYEFDAINDNGALAKQFGVSGFPSIFVVDGDGNIHFVTRGITSEPGLRLRLFITSLMN